MSPAAPGAATPAQSAAQPTPFAANSRYAGLPTATLRTREGRTIVYLTRRIVPPADAFAVLQFHTVVEGDRLDTIAARYLGDPEAYWRLCDANGAMRPDALTETPGRQLRIALPQGLGAPR